MPADPAAVKAVFLEVADLPAAERAGVLAARCGEDADLLRRVTALLAAHDLEDVGGATAVYAPDGNRTRTLPPSAEEAEGAVVAGRYKLRQRIGEGGMGTVWMADQTEPVKRKVAVKLIRVERGQSKTILARFEAERQAIALMDHPHIAKLLDAGTTDAGAPFFVMELVKGVPLTEFCDAHKLSIPDRLSLFRQICSAVQHAHQKGVIHRDLKPSNILVESHDGHPVPKVIDFGLAKATTGLQLTERSLFTAFGAVLGTPTYMAPEQATFNAVDVDTRADVYALGVILYELLTGTTPLARDTLKKAALEEVLRLIREHDPPAPSSRVSSTDAAPSVAANRQTEPASLGRLVKGELDWIVLKALSKDRDRRYDSAMNFARDIERFLNHEPVTAGPPTAAYRMRKFVRRHRGPVAAAALVLVSLLAGVVGTTFGLLRAEEKRREAEQARAAEAERAVGERRARERADRFRDKALDALRAATGEDVQKLIGEKKELTANEKAYLEAVARRWQSFARQEGDDEQSRAARAEGHAQVAWVWHQLGLLNEARPEFQRALGLWVRLAADVPADRYYRLELSRCHNNLANLLDDLQDPATVEHYKKALDIQIRLASEFPRDESVRRELAGTHTNLGNQAYKRGDVREAEGHHRDALAVLASLIADAPAEPNYPRDQARCRNNLAHALGQMGQTVEAEEQCRAAVATLRKLVAAFPANPDYRASLVGSHRYLGELLSWRGDRAGAVAEQRRALELAGGLATDFPAVPGYRTNLAESHVSLGNLLEEWGRTGEAEAEFRRGLDVARRLAADVPTVPAYRRQVALCHSALAGLFTDSGKYEEAEGQFRAALEVRERLAADHPKVLLYRHDLTHTHLNLGYLLTVAKSAKAGEQLRHAVTLCERLAADFPHAPVLRSELALAHSNLGRWLADTREWAAAEEHFRSALAINERLAADFPTDATYQLDLGSAYGNVGSVLSEAGRPADSLEWFGKGLPILLRLHVADPKSVTVKRYLKGHYSNQAWAYYRLGKHAEAVEDWGRAVELSPKEEKPGVRLLRTFAVLRGGKVAEAVTEVAELRKLPGWSDVQLYDFACWYAIASGEVADKQTEYADAAMEMLTAATRAGYQNAAHMKADKDLVTIRDRDDFKKLVADLEAKYPTPKETLPPPRADE